MLPHTTLQFWIYTIIL